MENTMFEFDIFKDVKNKSKKYREEAYRDFLMNVKLSIKEYPFSLKSENMYRGACVDFTVASWGGYFNADGVWTIFIAYRSHNPDHTIQHAWSWDETNQHLHTHRIMEFIN